MKKLVIFLITLLVVALDQVTKQLITRTMDLSESSPVIDNFLYITYHRNSGAAFGILQGQMLFFYVITAVTIIGILIWLSKLNIKRNRTLAIALALILGGALGNFVDRVIYQAVIDFIHTVWWGHSFPIFNVADIALVCGALLMLFDILILDRRGRGRGKDLYFKMDR